MRRWIASFGLPQVGDISSQSGTADTFNRDASFAPLGQEGSPSGLTGTGYAFRRGNNGSTNYVTQNFSQGGTAPTTSSRSGAEHVRIRIRRFPSVEEQWYALTNTGGGAFYSLTLTPGGYVKAYNSFAFPGTLLWTAGPFLLDTWYQFIWSYKAVPAVGGGIPPPVYSFTLLTPQYIGTSLGAPVDNMQFVRSLLGAESRVFVNNNLAMDFSDWICDDLGDSSAGDFVPPSGAVGLASANFTTGMRVETRRPQGLGSYQAWTTSGILAYQARQGIPPDPTPGGGVNLVTSNVAQAKVSYTFGSLSTMGIVGAVHAFRASLYLANGAGLHSLIFRIGSKETLFPFNGGSNQWVSFVMDVTDLGIFPVTGVDPSDIIEVGIQKSNDATSVSLQTVALEIESDENPYPTTLVDPLDDTIRVGWGQYIGNSTTQGVNPGFIPHWYSILPVAGAAGDGALWCDQDMGASGHAGSQLNGIRMCQLTAGGFDIAGSDGFCNQSGITYQWVAIRDPQQRGLRRGTITHTPQDGTTTNLLADAGFTPLALWAKITTWIGNVAAGYYRGPGHTTLNSSPLNAAQNASGIMAMGTGSFDSGVFLHLLSGGPSTTYTAWRADHFTGKKKWNAITYVGDGTGNRTVAIDLGDTAPIWAMGVPHDGASYIRTPGMIGTNSYLVGGTGLGTSANGITGGAINAVKVAAGLNANGVVYELFAIAGGAVLDGAGWGTSPGPGGGSGGTTDGPPEVIPPGPAEASHGCVVTMAPVAEGGGSGCVVSL